MKTWNVIVCSFDGGLSDADALRRDLAQAWSSPTAATFELLPATDLAHGALEGIHAVVLHPVQSVKPSQITSILLHLEEHGIPIILLEREEIETDHVRRGNALAVPDSTPTEHLVATLIGLLHRQRETSQLRRELSLSHRFHGGLRGEISRMHDELQLAAMVQREFLPREIPQLHGVSFAALWRPAHYVSGDIYEIIRLDEDHVGMFIADAVGHGVPAALMTMVICRSLQMKEINGSSYELLPPSEVLLRLNEEMIRRQGQTTRFATAVYALVDCRSRRVTIAGAGHPHPLLQHADGSTEAIDTPGGLLGVFEDEQYGQKEIDLAVDDRLLLYSDGFEQAFPRASEGADGRRVPSTRYREEFERLSRVDSPDEMIVEISMRIDAQKGSLHQADDLTLLCMHAGALAPAEGSPRTPGARERHVSADA